MKIKRVSFYLLLLWSICSCGKQEKVVYFPTGEVKSRAPLNDSRKYDGDVINYYKSGSIERVVPFRNGIVHGVVNSYYPNGNLYVTETWRHNKRSGETAWYYPNGQIKYWALLDGNRRIDSAKWYHTNGKISYRMLYDKKGRKVDFFAYEPNGKINLNHVRPLFLSDQDTLAAGQDYTFEIVLGNRRSNSINIKFLEPRTGVDSTKGVYTKTRYIIRRPSPGKQLVKVVLYQYRTNGDTLWIDDWQIQHTYYVKGKA
ncbi:toxin-antitoxin system YwqK family antitoxin [Hymenobacter sp. HDW8]|uniref:toxin-antitoxin system YwqK family antitoxin n=1 Tax=Hymenobacter sp. HDW8 TaxID=2714932 RepID=UPI00140752B1|nr:hypothetical protein [Hymenobacter sp. HDW8]QIL78376.1 hypothetical protein G7064_21410 [Hymenobacter sp. HDW8]